jgi:hypothetical protein
MRISKFQSISVLALACGFGLVACGPKAKTVESDHKTVSLTEAGEKKAIKAIAKDDKGVEIKDAKFAFASADKTVADVAADKGEIVAGKKSGKTKVTITIGDVKTEVPVSVDLYTKIAAEPAEVAIKAGETLPLKATVQNEAGAAVADAKVEFKSSDENIASVDAATGAVTGKAAGSATITLTAKKLTATVNVTVAASGPANLTVEPATADIKVGGEHTVAPKATDATGADAVGTTYTYASSDAAIAEVGADGKVTGKGKGTATITVTAGDKTASVTVNVK